MQNYSVEEAINLVQLGKPFEGVVNDSFHVKIEEYVPFVCAAIHNGSRFREELANNCALTAEERFFEEDPFTGDFISSLPITLIGKDSRYEYDLNRSLDECVYKSAWGKNVWKNELSPAEEYKSKSKHSAFYFFVDSLIEKLEKDFDRVLVYDIHSYNFQRHENTSQFNLGVENIDVSRYNSLISSWKNELTKIKIKKIPSTVSVNNIFYGRGNFLKHITEKFKKTVVLATEVKKTFMNEETGESFPLIINELSKGLKVAILKNSEFFLTQKNKRKSSTSFNLLSKGLSPSVLKVDKALYRMAKSFEILSYVNPLNIESEKKRFFKSKFSVNPDFRYRPITIDPHKFKAKMFSLNVEGIDDIHIRQLYSDVISSYADKVDLLSTLGTSKFLYNSLRYFGEPSRKDIENANFLLYCNDLGPESSEEELEFDFVRKRFLDETQKLGIKFKVEVSSAIPSDALVLNSQKKLVLKKGAVFNTTRLNALINHEVGVHVVTSANAEMQPLKVLSLGLPQNTYTQEGLAILAEYQCGGITIGRMKELGLRVLAVESLVSGKDFKTTYQELFETYRPDPEKLYYLVTRVYRGGGFTKDYLYLRGFRKIIQMVDKGVKIDNLMLGKTNHQYLPVLNEMVDRKILIPPSYNKDLFESPSKSNEILKYITSCIKG